MKLDKNYKVPEGFQPVLNYREDSVNGTPVVGLARLSGYTRRGLEFSIENGAPKLPLKKWGELWHVGWDIPNQYAIDADNNCWVGSDHGGELTKVPTEVLISTADTEEEKNDIRQFLGIALPMPEWAKTALSHGWVPPKDWTWENSK